MYEVYHQIFGRGIVIDDRFRRTQFLVRFERGFTLWIQRSSLLLLKKYEKKVAPIEVKPAKEGDFQARRMIEAFRLGIVPYYGVEDFTFGRRREIRRIEREFETFKRDGGNIFLIEGEYGTGKTHLMDYISLYALKNKFAISRIELDPFDVAPYKPRRVYREIVRNLSFIKDGTTYDFKGLLRLSKEIRLPKSHLFFSKVIDLLKRDENEALLWDWIEGEETPREYLNFWHKWKLPVILNHRSAVDIISYLLSGVGYIVKKMRVNGLVLLIDEGETLFHLYSRLTGEFGFSLYKGLVHTTLGDKRLLNFKLKGFTDLGIGVLDENGFVHSGVRATPYLYKTPSRIFLILSITPTPSLYYEKVSSLFPSRKKISLGNLEREEYEKMFNKIIKIYAKAYKTKFPSDRIERIKKRVMSIYRKGLRPFLKSTIEELDILRHYGDTPSP